MRTSTTSNIDIPHPLADTTAPQSLLIEGKNCRAVRRADRFSFIIDAADYFSAFARAVETAQTSIYIAGWDIDSRVALKRDDPEEERNYALGELLERVASINPELHVYILTWDYSVVFMFDREFFPLFKLGWNTHERVHFAMDSSHPVGGSQHQKIVVVDDSIAFVGGLDLSRSRWDTSDHVLNNPLRRDADGSTYLPFHDVNSTVSGPPAEALGDVFRDRWFRSLGEHLPKPPVRSFFPWPSASAPDLTNVDVAISLTEPLYGDRPESQEILEIYRDAIGGAERRIYIENQYFTSERIGEALAESLAQPMGPEIILVVPHQSSGWLETSIMDSRRAIILRKLRSADVHNRLGVYYPIVPGLSHRDMMVHSKLMIVDDRFVTLGSANLSNRSMGYDTECNIAIDSEGNPAVSAKVTEFRDRLLGEHMELAPELVGVNIEAAGSIKKLIESRTDLDRTLKPLDAPVSEFLASIGPTFSVADPEEPINPQRLLGQVLPADIDAKEAGRYLKLGVAALLLLGLAALWKWSPLATYVTIDNLAAWGSALRGNPFAPVIVPFLYIAAGMVMIPVTALVGATALVFSPLWAMIFAYLGIAASAALSYYIGQKLGKNTLRKIAGGKLNKISKRMARKGFFAVAGIRLLPIAPFQVINLVMGASHVSFRDYMIGTFIGVTPGVLGLSLFAGSIVDAVRHPTPKNIVISLAVLGALTVASLLINKYLSARLSAR